MTNRIIEIRKILYKKHLDDFEYLRSSAEKLDEDIMNILEAPIAYDYDRSITDNEDVVKILYTNSTDCGNGMVIDFSKIQDVIQQLTKVVNGIKSGENYAPGCDPVSLSFKI